MFQRRIYIALTVVLIISYFVSVFSSLGGGEVRDGYTEAVIPGSWRTVMADDLNSLPPEVLSDGLLIENRSVTPYVSINLDVMLPADMITETTGAIAVKNAAGKLCVLRGEERLELDPETDEVSINGKTEIIGGAVVSMNGVIYVSAAFLAEKLNIEYEFDASTRTAAFTGVRSSTTLPSSFALSEIDRSPTVLDQGELGACWAFASLTALESALLPEKPAAFVRDHLLIDRSADAESIGGASQMALSYMLSWKGPVSDETDVYGDSFVRSDLTAEFHVQGAQIYESPDVEALKEAVFYYGGTEAALYFVLADADNADIADRYYDADHNAYAYTGDSEVNHDVVIVGWDDTYSKENFPSSAALAGDGAFLCQNSWGTDFGDKGLFWVSYYSTQFAVTAMCYTEIGSSRNYDHIYQTDVDGATANAGYGDDTVYFANVYTAAGDETIKAVGFYTLGEDSIYEVYYVSDFTDETSLTDRMTVAAGEIAHRGYHTVKIDEKALEKGQRYAVVVRLTTPGLTHPAAIEKVTEAVTQVDISDGEGYLSSRGTYFKRTEEASDCNVCLKVYTDNREKN